MATVVKPTVFVLDDERTVRESLRWLIESVGLVVETFSSPREFLDTYKPDRPGCLVLDVRLPEMSGLEVQEWLQARGIRLPVIMITAYGEISLAVRAMKGGARDFLEKPFSDQVLLDRIQQCIEEDAKNRKQNSFRAEIDARSTTLTRRERQVMQLMVGGNSTKKIASELGISHRTVEVHRAKIMAKMKADSVADLVHMAMK